MPKPTFISRQHLTKTGGTADMTFAAAPGALSGDRQLLAVACFNGFTITTPSGWTFLDTYNTTTYTRLTLFIRMLDTTTAASGFSVPSVSDYAAAEVRTYRNATSIVTVASGSGATTGTAIVPKVSTLVHYWSAAFSNNEGSQSGTISAASGLDEMTPAYSMTWFNGLVGGSDPTLEGATAPTRTATKPATASMQWATVKIVGTVDTPVSLVEKIDAFAARVRTQFNDLTLNKLGDVDTTTTAPTDGQVLVYDLTTGLWKPGHGGPEVGAWENNLTTQFVYPPPIETDLQTTDPGFRLPTARQATGAGVFEIPITAQMLVGNTGADLGHETAIIVYQLFRVVGAGTSGNWNHDSSIYRPSAGTDSTNVSSTASSAAANVVDQRVTVTHVFNGITGADVGDILRMRSWHVNGANIKLDWWGARFLPTRVGKKMDTQGRYPLFRQITKVGGSHQSWTPATNVGLPWVVSSTVVGTRQWMDYGISIGQNTQPNADRVYFGSDTRGLMSYGDGLAGIDSNTVQLSSTGAMITTPAGDVNYTVDRLYVPAPPV